MDIANETGRGYKNMFQSDKFLELFNQAHFLDEDQNEVTLSNCYYSQIDNKSGSTWSMVIKGDRVYGRSPKNTKSFWVSIEISSAKVVDICNYSFESSHFYAKVAMIFKEIQFPCYIIEKKGNFVQSHNNDLYPVDENSQFLLDVFSPLKSRMVMYGPANCPRVKFGHLREEIRVEFDFRHRQIHMYYALDKVAILTSVDETRSFIQQWEERSNVIDYILDQALESATKLDSSSFRKDCTIFCFSEENHLGFSYYRVDGQIYYYFTSYLEEERIQYTTTDTQELQKTVLTYFNTSLRKQRIKALLEGQSENYMYRLFYDIFGYYEKFNDHVKSETSYSDFMEYVRKNYYSIKLNEVEKEIEGNIHDPYEKSYVFGDYVIVIGVEYDPTITICKLDEIKKSAIEKQ